MAITTKEKIIETFNLSIDALQKAHSAAEAKNFNGALESITASAGLTYNTLEWFFKNYLASIFPDSAVNASQWMVIEGNNFHRKVDLFTTSASPTLASTNLDVSIIKEFKQIVRNDPEHSGLTPHYNSLLKVLSTTRQLIVTYLNVPTIQLKNLPESQPFEIETTDEWLKMFTAVDSFSKEYNYILITDLSAEENRTIKPLALIDWNAIIDLDSNSEHSGLNSTIHTELSHRRSIHKFTYNDTLPISFSDDSCYWIFANGLTGRASSIFPDFRFWNSNYSPFLGRVLSKLQLAISSKPTIVIIMTENVRYATEIVKLVFNSFTTNASFVFATNDISRYAALSDEYEGNQVEISVAKLTTGLLGLKRYFNPLAINDEIAIPHKDSGLIELPQVDYTWLKEDLEILHKFSSTEHADSVDERIDFYKGGTIGVKGLMLNYDLPRDFTSFLEVKIENGLRDRVNKTISLFHYPGVGGTTISKRLGWRLKDKYPVAIMKTYRPNETINRIYNLFQLSSLPPFIIMDSESISFESRERIQQEALSRSFPVTFLQVQRKLTKPQSLTNVQFYLTEVLSDEEILLFAESYGELAPTKKQQLRSIVTSGLIKEKHPLFFGLTAFEESFKGLQDFVSKALKNANENQKKIISFISFISVYAQKSISAQSFTGILAHPESVAVKLEEYLNESLLHLIVREGDLMWRSLHYLIAKQYLKTLFGGDEIQMRIALSDLSIEFIELIGNRTSNPTNDEYEILDRLFIERYDEDVSSEEEKPFSKLIQEGLYDENAKLRVLIKLTEVFPDQAHFWSHLARFYNLIIKDQTKALECIETALTIDREDLDGNDSTLFHIKGMILKSQAGALMYQNWHKTLVDQKEIDEIKSLITQSNSQFEIARNMNPNSDYGYITNIDAITHYLDFRFKKSTTNTDRSKFLAGLDDFDLKLFTEARMLLEEVRSKLHHNPNDYYYVRCKNRLQEYFNNYSAIIQSWQNLLSSNAKTDRLAIRQNIVHAYVSRAEGWEKLPPKDIEKIIKLLVENINQDHTNSKNILLWFKAARYSQSIKISDAIQKLVQWRSIEPTVDVNFYLSILYVIEAINGNSVSGKQAISLIREVSEKSRTYPYRTFLSEWYGKGAELSKIKTKSSVISSGEVSREMIFDMNKLSYVEGKISNIKGPEAGEIEFASGLTASFIPARADGGKGFVRGRDENKGVKFILGFSYDGLKAFEVVPLPN